MDTAQDQYAPPQKKAWWQKVPKFPKPGQQNPPRRKAEQVKQSQQQQKPRESPQQQSAQSTKEQRIRVTLRRQHKTLLTAIDAIERDCQIIDEAQQIVDAIHAKARASQGQMSADDANDLESQENRVRLWKRSNEEKMAGCRSIIKSMDEAEAELLTIRPMTEYEKRKGAHPTQFYLEVSREQRLAVGAPVACKI